MSLLYDCFASTLIRLYGSKAEFNISCSECGADRIVDATLKYFSLLEITCRGRINCFLFIPIIACLCNAAH